MRRLFLLRHGPTHETAFTGWRDVPADLTDVASIGRLERFLPHAPIISSDLRRAVATADAVQGGRPRLPHDPGLREFDFGTWDGCHFRDVAATDRDLSRQFWERPGDVAPPGGESWNAVTARVTRSIDAAWRDASELIVVAHFGVILCHLAAAVRLDPYEALGHKIDPLSVTVLSEGAAGWDAERINHQP